MDMNTNSFRFNIYFLQKNKDIIIILTQIFTIVVGAFPCLNARIIELIFDQFVTSRDEDKVSSTLKVDYIYQSFALIHHHLLVACNGSFLESIILLAKISYHQISLLTRLSSIIMAQRGVDTSDEEYIPYFAGETLGSDSEHEYRYSDEDEEGYSDPEDFLFGEDDEDPNAARVWDDGFQPIYLYETYDKPPIPEFTGHPVGHGVDVTLEQSQSAFFKLFLDEEIVIYLCRCMNAKARFWFQEESARKGVQITTCNGVRWQDVTPNDIYLYFKYLCDTCIAYFYVYNPQRGLCVRCINFYVNCVCV